MSDYVSEAEDGSTSYSDFCDDDTIRAALTTRNDNDSDPNQVVAELSSSAATTSSVILGKRKSPELFDDLSVSYNYKRRTLSFGPIDLDSGLGSSQSQSNPLPSQSLSDSSPPTLLGHDTPLEPYIVAFNASVQRAMDARGLPWGVQWEIARLISLGCCSWEDISLSELDTLREEGLSTPDHNTLTPTAVRNAPIAPHVEDLFRLKTKSFGRRAISKEVQATSPWQELDQEDAAFYKHGPSGCLGFTPQLGTWYGGKVVFSIKVQANQHGTLQFILDHPVLGPSSRFTRCYGSAWLIRLRVSKEVFSKAILMENLKTILLTPLILNGLVFRFFYANKEHNAYLMATNEMYDGGLKPQSLLSHSLKGYRSFLDFFSTHNNLESNCNQTIAKWAARIALGLSSSIPGLMLDAAQIKEEEDIVSSSCPPGMKHASEMDMTDGCGLINIHALHALHKQLGLWKEAPVAIQCRLAGAKGLLLQHHGEEENSWTYPCVWLRPSQIKIKHTQDYFQNPAHRVIDILRASNMQSPIHLSREMITNLSENGVSPDVFVDLFQQFMDATITPLLSWDGQDAMPRLWAAVSREGNVIAARMARESAWTARARGVQHHHSQDSSDDEDEEEDDPNSSTHSTAWWGDDISGCPSSLEETVMAFLDSGFHPNSNPILARKLYMVAKKAVRSCKSKYRVMIPMSCSALIVPGFLQEGEIHVKCSERCLLSPDGQRLDRVIGDVLLPTDVQKVKAVFKPELDSYVNVIMFSTKGKRSLASMLGTGDYDGDIVNCIWQPSIVEQFSNADPMHAEPPASLHTHFQTSPTSHQVQELQRVLMSPFRDLYVVGTYSALHDNAIYSLGYKHPTTILLAWIFCTVLDGAKTGMTILPRRYSKDRNSKQYGAQFAPYWKTEPGQPMQLHTLPRQCQQPFVLDLLKDEMERVSDEQLRRIDDHFAPGSDLRDVGQAQQNALEAIKVHMTSAHSQFTEYMKATAPGSSRAAEKGKKGANFTNRSIESRQDKLRRMSRAFISGPADTETLVFSQEEVTRLRASYAYLYDWTLKGGSQFPWNVAMRELGAIKLRACGDFKPISQDFYEKMLMRRL
ncbi:RNA dependent RNA polymerase-domain-containing protein [Multifurca ochricompacta]|uniref:RNA-dependent RNA polymerase n=1 Tax=Multifurca ochricompacta TaxID=376703 RepID=A0AAD4M944_9AGAM|nr:RNA dependent RNA polymerase-domain-containing protein [Multifurca ochricompacta]